MTPSPASHHSDGYVREPDVAHAIWYMGSSMRLLATGRETASLYALIDASRRAAASHQCTCITAKTRRTSCWTANSGSFSESASYAPGPAALYFSRAGEIQSC